MSLPPGFLDELRTRTSLAQVVGRKVLWDNRKSNQGQGDWWAPCPFHQEKSASFHVKDREGYYYCFGCHAKGDAISFVRETENVGFMEAIEILATEAGMQMPARDPRAQEKADERSELADVMEAAVRFYRLSLKTNAATQARAYLAKRGLSEADQDRFDIGFAPEGNALIGHLTGQGVSMDKLLASGLAAKPDDGRSPYDRFRGRIMFPIRNAQGRCISFGGRSMDPEARAKYLNGNETILFDKGRSLYNHGPARVACGKGQPLIVAEGYMDVIALSLAGFEATVAPLGTAVTETQLQLLWRISPEPIIALDGDKAGIRAALRVIDLALPMLAPGQSLRFAVLPEGLDPDDLIKAKGAQAMQEVIEGARPLIDLLWNREVEGKVFDSPERKAGLEKALREATARIEDRLLREHYEAEIKQKLWQFFRQKPQAQGAGANGQGGKRPFTPQSTFGAGGKGRFGKFVPPAVPTPEAMASALVGGDAAYADYLREAVILATLLVTPQVILSFLAPLEGLDLTTDDHRAILSSLLRHAEEEDAEALRAQVLQDVGAVALEKLMSLSHVTIAPPVRKPGNAEMAQQCVSEELAKLRAERGHRSELAVALDSIREDQGDDEGLTWRLGQSAEALGRATRSEAEDTAEYDFGKNGAPMRRNERNALDTLLSNISLSKRK
ncbi:DNA primase [Aquimixticola soesokkakensis]|uniref:DNA primase n=1 Tax=Aquimixticola soesokkakensis TaxID=1519096 RepID=A0A1Y5SC59_9RHOB|nr:DNA primase [Aquimixticola soesokkakensis]SLN37265.1 DNA primase [Aquimixticola soesokkakensis]